MRKNSLEEENEIEDFLNKLQGAKIIEFRVLEWSVNPSFQIVTDKCSFILHANDIGIFIDNIEESIQKYECNICYSKNHEVKLVPICKKCKKGV